MKLALVQDDYLQKTIQPWLYRDLTEQLTLHMVMMQKDFLQFTAKILIKNLSLSSIS